MKRKKKIINWLLIGVIGIYLNMVVCLLADYSLWYFFGILACICLLIWLMNKLKNRF